MGFALHRSAPGHRHMRGKPPLEPLRAPCLAHCCHALVFQAPTHTQSISTSNLPPSSSSSLPTSAQTPAEATAAVTPAPILQTNVHTTLLLEKLLVHIHMYMYTYTHTHTVVSVVFVQVAACAT